jgi:hypothetical protein
MASEYGNVVSLDTKRRELAERQEQESVEYNISGDIPATILCCECGCEALTLFAYGDLLSAECLGCGEPMILDILSFLGGEFAE